MIRISQHHWDRLHQMIKDGITGQEEYDQMGPEYHVGTPSEREVFIRRINQGKAIVESGRGYRVIPHGSDFFCAACPNPECFQAGIQVKVSSAEIRRRIKTLRGLRRELKRASNKEKK